jgi:RNA polymerase sigma factor (sigma-70 family)
MAGKPELISDEAILSGLIRGGTSADNSIRLLYRNYYGLLSQYIINNSGNEQDAEDIFQEVLISFVNIIKAGKFRGEAGIKTFLYAMNRNAWLNELKRRGRAEAREHRYDAMVEKSERDAGAALEYGESAKQLVALVEQLGEQCKKILLQFYYQNLSMKEILEHSDYENEQVVRNKKYTCLKKMEKLVQANPQLHQQLKNLLHE